MRAAAVEEMNSRGDGGLRDGFAKLFEAKERAPFCCGGDGVVGLDTRGAGGRVTSLQRDSRNPERVEA